MKVSSKYMAMADVEVAARDPHRPFTGLVDSRVAAFRCFQRYSRNATRDIVDGQGLARWVTQKQAIVGAIIARVAMTATGQTTMQLVAAEAGCTVSTVSRTIRKLETWELYAVDVRRGRYGGITVHRPGWERFWEYVWAARRKASDVRNRARFKLASLRETYMERGKEAVTVTVTSMVASLKPEPMSFASRVFYERAMLALEDPDGEYEALHPITDVDNALLLAEDERRRKDQAIRDAAYRGDWDAWETLRRNRWDAE